MKSLLLLLGLMLVLVPVATAQTTDLFISEYVEGSGFNKALEIFNGTGDPIDLGNYTLERYNNGILTPTVIALDPVVLVPGDVFVITNSGAVPALLNLADQTSSEINFNGDDALVLMRSSVIVDCIGQVGFDPGSAWSCDLGSTLNSTLQRVASFCVGDSDPSDAFDPCASFDFFPSDYFTGLGSHSADCTSVANAGGSWDALKACFR